MATAINPFLMAGAALNGAAALLHVACIVMGPSWYRYLGAGEQMVRLVSKGHWFPTVITLGISAMLAIWSLYALSGAGLIPKLPFLRLALCAITGVYLLRALAFPLLIARIPGNSLTFWYTSSAICLVFGTVHLVGLWQVWRQL